MKKIIMLALVLTTIVTASFSRNMDAVNQKVLSSFSKSFHNAEDVRWEVRKEMYKVAFKINGQIMFAYYNPDGEQIALTRNILPEQLPLNLAVELKSMYNQYWLTDLFEVALQDETSYYATIENATHITVLKADGTIGWMVFSKEKRK